MANFRCYDSQNIIQDSKERSLSVKRCTIQKCIEKDLQQYGTANPPTPLTNPKLNNLSAASGNTLKVVYPPSEIVYNNQNLTAETWQNGVVDPNHTLFYDKCINNYANTNTLPTLTS